MLILNILYLNLNKSRIDKKDKSGNYVPRIKIRGETDADKSADFTTKFNSIKVTLCGHGGGGGGGKSGTDHGLVGDAGTDGKNGGDGNFGIIVIEEGWVFP
jgi:hypothetical protein